MEHARGDAVITMDSDLQHPPNLIGTILEKWREGYDVVLTVRAEDPTLSLFCCWSAERLLSRPPLGERRANSDRRRRLPAPIAWGPLRRALIRMREVHRFLRGMVHWLGFRTIEVPYVPNQRAAGKSHYSLRKMLRLAGDGIFAFSMMPLRWLAILGLGTHGGSGRPRAVPSRRPLMGFGVRLGPLLLSVLFVRRSSFSAAASSPVSDSSANTSAASSSR